MLNLLPEEYACDEKLRDFLQDISRTYDQLESEKVQASPIKISPHSVSSVHDAELFASNERYEYVTKATFDAIWDWHLITNHVYRGEGYSTLFGYGINEIRKDNFGWELLIHPNDRERVIAGFEQVIAGTGANWTDEYRYKMANGDYAFVVDKAVILRDKNAKAYRMIGAMQDSSRLIQAAAKLDEQRKFYEEVLNGLPADIAVFNAKHEYLFVNPKAIKNEDIRTWIIGRTDVDYCIYRNISLDIAARRRSIFEKVVQSKVQYEWVESLTTKEGEKEYISRCMHPLLNKEGEIELVIGYGINITDTKKAADEKILLVEELTKNYADLKQFSYITSHNLRAPLTNLVSIANLIDTSKITDGTLVKLIEGFKTSTHHLDETLKDLIKVLIIKENSNKELEEVSLAKSVTSVMSSTRTVIDSSGATIITDFAEIEKLHFSKVYMDSIFLNMVTNAIKYAHPERKPVIHISSKKINGAVQLIFSDNGIGFNIEKVKDRIFGLYQRFHNRPDSKGIGLYLVRSQVIAMGGTIDVESEENIGTKFIINLKVG